jgi:hypothetical protein
MTTINQHQSTYSEPQPPQPKIDWVDIIKHWKISGMSQAAYCKANNIKLNQFTYQNVKLSSRAKTNSKWLPVRVMQSKQATAIPSIFVIHYPNGMRLHIPVNAHPEAIKALLICLGTRQC